MDDMNALMESMRVGAAAPNIMSAAMPMMAVSMAASPPPMPAPARFAAAAAPMQMMAAAKKAVPAGMGAGMDRARNAPGSAMYKVCTYLCVPHFACMTTFFSVWLSRACILSVYDAASVFAMSRTRSILSLVCKVLSLAHLFRL